MTPRRRLALASLAALVVAGCSFTNTLHRIGSEPYTKGSGNQTTVTRTIAAFHGVAAGPGVEVHVGPGAAPSAAVSADDNLVAMITTEVRDGILVVEVNGSVETKNPLKVTAKTSSAIDSLSAGAGATVDAESIATETLTVRADAGSSIRAGGRATSVDLSANAGASADLRNVEARAAKASVSSGASATVRASEAASGTCDSGATLKILGSPATREVHPANGCVVSYE